MKNLTWQNPEQLFVAQELINKVKSKCCGIKVYYFCVTFSAWSSASITRLLFCFVMSSVSECKVLCCSCIFTLANLAIYFLTTKFLERKFILNLLGGRTMRGGAPVGVLLCCDGVGLQMVGGGCVKSQQNGLKAPKAHSPRQRLGCTD